MIIPGDYLGRRSGGKVLDVATGTGGFIEFLLPGLIDHGEIIGMIPAVAREYAPSCICILKPGTPSSFFRTLMMAVSRRVVIWVTIRWIEIQRHGAVTLPALPALEKP